MQTIQGRNASFPSPPMSPLEKEQLLPVSWITYQGNFDYIYISLYERKVLQFCSFTQMTTCLQRYTRENLSSCLVLLNYIFLSLVY